MTAHDEWRARRADIARLYNEGVSAREIAARYGVLPGTIHKLIWQMRKDGWDLPYRHRRHAA